MQCHDKSIRSCILAMLSFLLAIAACAQESRWNALDARIVKLQGQGKNKEALPLAEEALHIAETTFGAENPNTATALGRLGLTYFGLGEYDKAEPLYQRSLAIYQKNFGSYHPAIISILTNLADLYYRAGRSADMQAVFKRTVSIFDSRAQQDLREGNYAEAEALYQRTLAIREKVIGADHTQVANNLEHLAGVYGAQSEYAKAEPLLTRSLSMYEKALGPDHPLVAESLHKLAYAYFGQGKFAEAEPLYKRSIAISEKSWRPYNFDLAGSLNDLALLYDSEGRYADVEVLYKRSLAIWEKDVDPQRTDSGALSKASGIREIDLKLELANGLNNLANLYKAQGRYAEAEPLYQRSLAIREEFLGPDHRSVAQLLNNFANLYFDERKYAQAAPLHEHALAILEKALRPDDPGLAPALANLANVYRALGKVVEAESLYSRSLRIDEKAFGSESLAVASDLSNLAALYTEQGKYSEAEPLYKRSLAIDEKARGPEDPRVAGTSQGLANLYSAQGRYVDAEPFFERNLEALSKQFKYRFSYMSEKDRLEFMQLEEPFFAQYFSFCHTYGVKNPGLIGKMYDVLLWEKEVVGRSIATLRARVEASGEAQAIELFEELAAKKNKSAGLATSRPEGWRELRLRDEAYANELEQQLARRVSSLAEEMNLTRVTWRDVQKTLAPSDAAVEFAKFQLYDGKKWADKEYYVALVIRPGAQQPALVQLGEANQIEGESFSAYRADVDSRSLIQELSTTTAPWRNLYDRVWKPLEAPLGDTQRVYVSLDGALNEVPLGVLEQTNGHRVMEKYDIRFLSSTRDLLRPSHAATSNTAIIVGNPRFLLSDEAQRVAVNRLREAGNPRQVNFLKPIALPPSPAAGTLSRDLAERGTCSPPPPAGGVLCPLPGTAAEVQAIAELLREKRWLVSSYQDEEAIEEVVKSAASPRVLHLATHGFFLSDKQLDLGNRFVEGTSKLEDPMLRSGLLFAGADRMLNGQPPIEGIENGVMTAYEASTLNLHGTELVVLSACETGRGQVQTGEGVFGLRRALQEAGAETVLMSLWSVPDRETQELMTLFYQNWLSGMEKPEALRRAQMKERDQVTERYGRDLPYYWGAFILVGR